MAVALIHDPQVILFDEPTVSVDPQSRNHIFESIERLEAEGRTVIYTTHYMEEAQRLCDRIGIMDAGEILALDTVDGLYPPKCTMGCGSKTAGLSFVVSMLL